MKSTSTAVILIACTALFALVGCEEADLQAPAEHSMCGGAEGSGELAAYSAQAKPHIFTCEAGGFRFMSLRPCQTGK